MQELLAEARSLEETVEASSELRELAVFLLDEAGVSFPGDLEQASLKQLEIFMIGALESDDPPVIGSDIFDCAS